MIDLTGLGHVAGGGEIMIVEDVRLPHDKYEARGKGLPTFLCNHRRLTWPKQKKNVPNGSLSPPRGLNKLCKPGASSRTKRGHLWDASGRGCLQAWAIQVLRDRRCGPKDRCPGHPIRGSIAPETGRGRTPSGSTNCLQSRQRAGHGR